MKPLDKEKFNKQKILFLDNHLCIVIKPSGQTVQSSDKERGLEDDVKECLQDLLGKPTIYLRPIHRLDKPVEGIVIFARSSKALSRLSQLLREKRIKKYYVALTTGKTKRGTQRLKHLLLHGEYKAEVVQKEGKEAELLCRPILGVKQKQLLSIRLLTGRYHQIRAQLGAIGCPIIGDLKYGSGELFGTKNIALYHTKVSFLHPVTKKQLTFKYRPQLIMDMLSSLARSY